MCGFFIDLRCAYFHISVMPYVSGSSGSAVRGRSFSIGSFCLGWPGHREIHVPCGCIPVFQGLQCIPLTRWFLTWGGVQEWCNSSIGYFTPVLWSIFFFTPACWWVLWLPYGQGMAISEGSVYWGYARLCLRERVSLCRQGSNVLSLI